MTIQEAFKKVKGQFDGSNRTYLYQCLDLDTHWAFCFFPSKPEEGEPVFGIAYDIIHKINGQITHRRFVDDVNLFTSGKKLDTKQFEK